MDRLRGAAVECHRRPGVPRLSLARGVPAGSPRGARPRAVGRPRAALAAAHRARLALPVAAARRVGRTARRASSLLIVAGMLGLATILAIAFAIDINGWTWPALGALFGPLSGRQPGLGYGAAAVAAASLMFVCHGVALRGWAKGDTFVAGAIGASVALVDAVHALSDRAPVRARVARSRRQSVVRGVHRAPRLEPHLGHTAAWSSTRCSSG